MQTTHIFNTVELFQVEGSQWLEKENAVGKGNSEPVHSGNVFYCDILMILKLNVPIFIDH